MSNTIQKQVQQYYGAELTSSDDLKTNACCTDTSLPTHVKEALSNVHDDVLARYYGCGLIAPTALEGCRVLDLGCGSGRDVYVLAQLVGESGEIVGVDMTKEQLAVANQHKEWHRKRFGYKKSNVSFIEGELEKLGDLGLEKGSFDIIISNCVINLCSDKEAVMKAAKELLKAGGEMYFSDVYTDRRVPEALQKDPVLYGECLSGALYINDFENIIRSLGFTDPRMTESRRLTIDNPKIEKVVGEIQFYSVTYRLFNLEGLEPHCEDYGQSVKYKGSVTTEESTFVLDDHHTINVGEIFAVCGNTYRMLNETRYAPHFEFRGTFDTHYGIFAGCGGALSATDSCCTPSALAPSGSDVSCEPNSEPSPNQSTDSSCCTPTTATASQKSESCCTPSLSTSLSTSPLPTFSLTPTQQKQAPPALISTKRLNEVWFHTGTNCNLSCDGCLEGASPNDDRLGMLSFEEARPLIDEAKKLRVSQLSFTGGEPFINPDFVKILDYALDLLPCLVLTNGTRPFHNAFNQIKGFAKKAHTLSFRISLDNYNQEKHDVVRGKGSFDLALKAIKALDDAGMSSSIARREEQDEESGAVEAAYRLVLTNAGISPFKRMIAFPDLLAPHAHPTGIPTITESHLAPFKGETGFMCETSRMVVKEKGIIGIYACTLVDDDESYNLGSTLEQSLEKQVHLTHHRCYSCYNDNASYSEL